MAEKKQNSGSDMKNEDKKELTVREVKKKKKELVKKKKHQKKIEEIQNREEKPFYQRWTAYFTKYFMLVLAIFLFLCVVSGGASNWVGVVGKAIRSALSATFGGITMFFIPLFLFVRGLFFISDLKANSCWYRSLCSVLCITLFSIIVFIVGGLKTDGITYSYVGGFLGGYLEKWIGEVATVIIFSIIFVVLLPIVFEFSPAEFYRTVKNMLIERRERRLRRKEMALVEESARLEAEAERAMLAAKNASETTAVTPVNKKRKGIYDVSKDYESDMNEKNAKAAKNDKKSNGFFDYDDETATRDIDMKEIFIADSRVTVPKNTPLYDQERDPKFENTVSIDIPAKKAKEPKKKPVADLGVNIPDEELEEENAFENDDYCFPPIDLLEIGEKSVDDYTQEVQSCAAKIIETLYDFNIEAKVVNIVRGPRITRYELALAKGVRVGAILKFEDDISVALSSTARYIGQIPNKPYVGIEVPNGKSRVVRFRDLIEDKKFTEQKSKVAIALGAGVEGEPVYGNIADMPHVLIAGATGAGKSVCINTLITSILYRARPDEVKLILVDPKEVEFSPYKDIPHLLMPVVNDAKTATGALKWAVAEMERRYGLIKAVGANIAEYAAETANDPDAEKLPYIVIIIDELNDLMMTAPKDVEASILRLAQKARAAGIHLVLGTQRPSVDVLTGVIKANIPSRIAFTVASQVDSRTIFDRAGAERLLGKGDMYYLPMGVTNPIRIQGALISRGEVTKVCNFIRNNSKAAEYDLNIVKQVEAEASTVGQKSGSRQEGGEEQPFAGYDPLFEKAMAIAVEQGNIATSALQRRLQIGYGRAAKIIDQMEALGFVSPRSDSMQKPREVLIDENQFAEWIMKKNNEAEDMTREII